MMSTKYGDINSKAFDNYLRRMKDRIFKILPMHEESCPTIDSYITNLNRELSSHENIVNCKKYEDNIIELINTIESLRDGSDLAQVKSDVFKSISIIKKMMSNVDRGDHQ